MIWTKAWRDFVSHGSAFAGSIFMMGLGIALLIGFLSAYLNLGQSAERTYARLDFLDLSCYLRPSPPSRVERVRGLPSVAAVEGRRQHPTRILLKNGEAVNGLVLGIPGDRELTVNRLHIHEGSLLGNQRGLAFLELRFARAYGYRVGDLITLQEFPDRRSFRVGGLVSSPEFIWLTPERLDPRPAARRFGVLFLSHKDVASLCGDDSINEIHLRLKPGANVKSATRALEHLLEGERLGPVVGREEQTSNSLLQRDRRAFAGVAAVFPVVLLMLSGIMLFLTLWQLLHMQRKQIGILLCLGLPTWRVVAQYCLLAGMVAAASTAAGFLVGPLLSHWGSKFYVDSLGLPFWVEQIQPGSLIGGALTAAVISLLAALAALRELLRCTPLELMRYDFSTGRPDAALPRLLHFTRWLGYSVAFPLRNLLRQPWRSLTMLAGIALSTTFMLMTLAIIDSQKTTVDFYLTRVHRYDLKIDLKNLLTSSDLPPVEHWPGVTRVERGLFVGVTLMHHGNRLERGIWGLGSDSQLLQLYNHQGQPLTPARQQGILLAPIAWRSLQIRAEGQELQLEIPNGQQHPEVQKIRVGPLLYEPVMGPPKCEITDLQKYRARSCGGAREVFNILLVKAEAEAVDAVRHRLNLDRRVRKVETLRWLRKDIDDLLRMVNAYLSLMLICSALIAIAVIHMCCTLNLSERKAEVACLLVQGVRQRDILRWLLSEVLCLWGLGLGLGVALGHQAGNWLLGHYQSDLIDLRLHLRATSVASTAAASLGVCLLASYPPIRRLFGLGLGDATRSPE